MRKIIIHKADLERLYSGHLFSSKKISNIYHCDQGVILRNLRKYDIQVRNPKKKIIISKKQLKLLYIKKNLSTYKIANFYGCDPKTIYLKLKEFKITTRPLKTVGVTKEKLIELYNNKRFSLASIGKIYNCCAATIYKKMAMFNIPLRETWETNVKHLKFDFSGNLLEKSYLLGFRAGDLGVRRTSKATGYYSSGV